MKLRICKAENNYVNLVEIVKVALEIQMAEFGNFTIPVNNTLVRLVSSFGFLVADTLLCVLITMFREFLQLMAILHT